jgi:hypothetical protein
LGMSMTAAVREALERAVEHDDLYDERGLPR